MVLATNILFGLVLVPLLIVMVIVTLAIGLFIADALTLLVSAAWGFLRGRRT